MKRTSPWRIIQNGCEVLMGENCSCTANARNHLRKYVEKAEARVWRKGKSVWAIATNTSLFIELCSFSLLSMLNLLNLPIFPILPLPCGHHCGSSGCKGKDLLIRGQEKDLGKYLAPWLWIKLMKTF